jgi:hypothetical protein
MAAARESPHGPTLIAAVRHESCRGNTTGRVGLREDRFAALAWHDTPECDLRSVLVLG